MKKRMLFGAMSLILMISMTAVAQKTVDVDTKVDGDKKIVKIRKGGGDFEQDLLNLTDAQKKEFKKLDLAFEKDIVSTKNELDVARLEMEVEMGEDNPDLKKINGLIDSIHQKEATIEKKRVASEFKKRDLLTDEQKKNWVMRGPQMKKDIIMLNSGEPENLMWIGDDETHLPMPPKIEKRIEIENK